MVREVVRTAEKKRGRERRRRGGRRRAESKELAIVGGGEEQGAEPCYWVHVDLMSSCGGLALDEFPMLTVWSM